MLLSLVAAIDGHVLGHILYSLVTIESDGVTCTGAELGPMADWFNFTSVVSGQLLILFALACLRRIRPAQIYFILWRSMLLGLPLGFLYDILIGQSQLVFHYSGVPDNWIFTAANGLLSYGFAIATAFLLPVPVQRQQTGGLRLAGIVLCVAATAFAFLQIVLSLPTLVSMFVTGAILVLGSEGLALLFGYIGPVYSLTRGNYKPIGTLWFASIVIGAFYETLNGFFPLWHWQEAGNMAHWRLELIIVTLGYFTLFLPMLILSRLLIRNRSG
ncbi:MAG: hypothetical protein L0Z73_09090 [Gammaproteobacteria bacterium]|nr:hypothetical protein [Gammaproteobacteria bacterium]